MTRERTAQDEYIVSMEALDSFYDEPGERGWILEAYKHGFMTSSAIITETAPMGGPPLHSHHTEEMHVLPECRIAYVMGSSAFEVQGPCVVKIPPETPHTFLNLSDKPVRLVCFFPSYDVWNNYVELGTNPLLERYGVSAPQISGAKSTS
jgi:mannose-6-phosphate isomerase-like protein (cupin superfamily)